MLGLELTPAVISAFFQVVMIDVVLAGDNAIVVGALAAGLPPESRRRVIMIGIAAALILRIIFALMVTRLLSYSEYGLVLAGGLLLLWVAWRMWRELHRGDPGHDASGIAAARSFASAAWSVAVAGAAREHPYVLILGLVLSVALMGVAANVIAQYIERYRWIAYIGLLVILYVAAKMIWEGYHQTMPTVQTIFA